MSASEMRTRFVEKVLEEIYKIPLAYIKKKEVNLIARNSQLHGNDQLGMRVGNQVWGKDVYLRNRRPLPNPFNKVHPSLKDEVEELVEFINEVNGEEMPYIKGYLRSTAMAFTSVEELLQLFPDILHPVIKANWPLVKLVKDDVDPAKLQKYKEETARYQTMIRVRLTKNLLIS